MPALAIDALPGIWSTWMQFGFDLTQRWTSLVQPWWQLPDLRAGDLPSAGAKQLTEDLAHDPLLKSIEQMWNANPLHDVIPPPARFKSSETWRENATKHDGSWWMD